MKEIWQILIQSQDRSYYIGASDTSTVVGNWTTKTFENWWLEKLGLNKNNFSTEATKAGNNYEHKILKSLEIENLQKDKQIIIDRLRVNLDGNTDTCIYEVKTHKVEKKFKVSKQYWRQAQVEMYASKIHKLFIVAYALEEQDYNNYFNKVDKNRLQLIAIEYDEKFIKNEYIPKLQILSECLKKGVFPNANYRNNQ
nr:MAG TPA: Exonuclease [Caudoviricetes sp.]